MSEENKDQLGQGTPTQSEPKVEQELSPQDLEKVAGGVGANAAVAVANAAVAVAFEEGDPDKPIVVGSVYNATARPRR